MPVFNKYTYQPLSEANAVRLVALDPTTDGTDPLTCRIVEQQTSAKHLDYAAVSYAWGKLELSQTLEIRCDGDVKFIKITRNLDTFLRCLRTGDKPQYLWIDAICLNQDDVAEKAQQIPAMGNIYRKAATVDIWIGSENPATARLFAFFRKLSRLPDVNKWKTQWEMAKRIFFLMKKLLRHEPAKAMGDILDFFRQPWFSRRWIIQEACLASCAVVHCGNQSISLPLLNLAATRLQRLDLSDYAIKVAANLGCQMARLSVLELLWHFHDAACLEPKDRIAALLSLGIDGQQFQLDYTKHWAKIYQDFASYTYSRGHNDIRLQLLLHLFEFGSISRGDDTSYPSWVPDWSHSRRRRLPYDYRTKNTDTFEPYPKSPGRSEKAMVTFYHDSLQIHWSMSAVGPRSHRAAFAATLDHSRHTEESNTEQVIKILENLFPSVPEGKLGMMALVSLLQKVSEFRHPDAEREKTSKSLGRFEKNLSRHLSESHYQTWLVWLRTLESVLRDFCLVELELHGHDSVPGRGYGIGPDSMRVDDIVIPLWVLEDGTSESRFHPGMSVKGIQFSTMLAVRFIGEQSSDVSGEDMLAQTGRILGPVTCVTLTRAANNSDRPTGSRRNGVEVWKQRSWIRIV